MRKFVTVMLWILLAGAVLFTLGAYTYLWLQIDHKLDYIIWQHYQEHT